MKEDNMFMNSSAVVIEYFDIIKSPWLTALQVNKNNHKLYDVLNMDAIKYLNDCDLYEWYKTRHNINPFKDLNTAGHFTDDELDQFMDVTLSTTREYFSESKPLEFVHALHFMMKQPFTTTYYVYTPEKCQFAEDDMHNLFDGKGFKFINGDFIEATKDVDMDCTYVLSDVTKLQLLYDAKRLNCNSILVAQDYAYNRVNGFNTPFKVDYESFMNTCIFKFAYFIASKVPSEYILPMILGQSEKK